MAKEPDLQKLEVAERDHPWLRKVDAGMRAAANFATFGYADRISAWAESRGQTSQQPLVGDPFSILSRSVMEIRALEKTPAGREALQRQQSITDYDNAHHVGSVAAGQRAMLAVTFARSAVAAVGSRVAGVARSSLEGLKKMAGRGGGATATAPTTALGAAEGSGMAAAAKPAAELAGGMSVVPAASLSARLTERFSAAAGAVSNAVVRGKDAVTYSLKHPLQATAKGGKFVASAALPMVGSVAVVGAVSSLQPAETDTRKILESGTTQAGTFALTGLSAEALSHTPIAHRLGSMLTMVRVMSGISAGATLASTEAIQDKMSGEPGIISEGTDAVRDLLKDNTLQATFLRAGASVVAPSLLALNEMDARVLQNAGDFSNPALRELLLRNLDEDRLKCDRSEMSWKEYDRKWNPILARFVQSDQGSTDPGIREFKARFGELDLSRPAVRNEIASLMSDDSERVRAGVMNSEEFGQRWAHRMDAMLALGMKGDMNGRVWPTVAWAYLESGKANYKQPQVASLLRDLIVHDLASNQELLRRGASDEDLDRLARRQLERHEKVIALVEQATAPAGGGIMTTRHEVPVDGSVVTASLKTALEPQRQPVHSGREVGGTIGKPAP